MDALTPGTIAREWRVGRKLGHTVYAQLGRGPSDDDVFLFTTHNRALAEHIVAEHNELRARHARLAGEAG
jgi:hypothetical protein